MIGHKVNGLRGVRHSLCKRNVLRVLSLLILLIALLPLQAHASRLDSDARVQSFRTDVEELSRRPKPSDVASRCETEKEGKAAPCLPLLMTWGGRALALEQNDVAIAYYHKAMEVAFSHPNMRIEFAIAWAHWSLALSEKYISKDLLNAPEVKRAMQEFGDERLSPGFTTGDRSLLRLFRAIESQWFFYRRVSPLDELYPTTDLPTALIPTMEIPLLARNAQILFSKGNFSLLDTTLQQLRRLCDTENFASDQCLGAAYNGLVLSFYQGKDSELSVWRDRLLQAVESSQISDRRFAFVLAALGLSDFVTGDALGGIRNFEAAIAHHVLIGGEYDRDLNILLSSYAASLAENGNYNGALAISGLTATSSGPMESGSRYARLLSQRMLGVQQLDVEYEYQTCETYWDVKTCLLLWDHYLDVLSAVKTEEGDPILPMINSVRSPEEFTRLGLSKQKVDEFGKARSDLDEIVGLMSEASFPVDRVPLLSASRALRIGRYQWAEDRTNEALDTLLSARQTVQNNGLATETVSIEADSLLSRIEMAKGCAVGSYKYSKSALKSIRDRQQQKREYDSSAINEIKSHSPKIMDFIAISYRLGTRPQQVTEC